MLKAFVRSARRVMTAIGLGRLVEILYDRKKRYRTPLGPSRSLNPHTLEPIVREMALEADRPTRGLYKTWLDVPCGWKWLHYFDVYEELFKPLTSRPIRFLEIGVYKGASLETWRKYFHPQSVIVGVDIDPECRTFNDPDRGIFVRIGDQSDAEFLKSVSAEFGPSM